MIDNGWYRDQWGSPKPSLSIKVEESLEDFQSDFQHVEILQAAFVGKVMLLDGIIMLTEFDEFTYHEMIAHPALHTHPDPQSVLVIGGGDGGTLREALKHPSVRTAHLCEIDPAVCEMARKHFPRLASGFDDPRTALYYEDAAQFIKSRPETYDVILIDSSDPIGPAEVLFQEAFYRDVASALKPGGIAISQSESMFYDVQIISRLFEFNRQIFPVLHYYYTMTPTYPSGTIGFSFCSKGPDPLGDAVRSPVADDLRYYSRDMHRAAFTLPPFLAQKLP